MTVGSIVGAAGADVGTAVQPVKSMLDRIKTISSLPVKGKGDFILFVYT